MKTSSETAVEDKYDYCFIGSGVILDRLLLKVPFSSSRCLIISDQYNEASIHSKVNSFTLLSRQMAIDSLGEFDVGTLIILAKTHLWPQPVEFEALIQKMRSRVRDKVIHLSSGSVYGEASASVDERFRVKPLTVYGTRKAAEEKCVSDSFRGHAGVQILRVSNVFGDSRFHDFTNQCLKAAIDKSSVKVYSNGDIVRDFLFVDCLVDALLHLIAWESKEEHLVLNLSTGTGTSIAQVMSYISEETGLTIRKIDYPRPNELVRHSVLDNSAILTTIPWKPIKLEIGLKRYLREAFPDLTSDK
jgi:dTDP-4-dehydrorhamnose reductase